MRSDSRSKSKSPPKESKATNRPRLPLPEENVGEKHDKTRDRRRSHIDLEHLTDRPESNRKGPAQGDLSRRTASKTAPLKVGLSNKLLLAAKQAGHNLDAVRAERDGVPKAPSPGNVSTFSIKNVVQHAKSKMTGRKTMRETLSDDGNKMRKSVAPTKLALGTMKKNPIKLERRRSHVDLGPTTDRPESNRRGKKKPLALPSAAPDIPIAPGGRASDVSSSRRPLPVVHAEDKTVDVVKKSKGAPRTDRRRSHCDESFVGSRPNSQRKMKAGPSTSDLQAEANQVDTAGNRSERRRPHVPCDESHCGSKSNSSRHLKAAPSDQIVDKGAASGKSETVFL